jgi:hypothetical protein
LKRIFFAAIAMSLAASFAQAATSYSVQLIAGEDGVPGSFQPTALSPKTGLVVGYSWVAGDRLPHRAVWQQGELHPLRAHGKDEMSPSAVSDRGVVAGTRATAGLTGYSAIYWSRNGRAHALPPLTPGSETYGEAVSTTGDVAGMELGPDGWIPVVWHRGIPTKQSIPAGLSGAIPYAMSPGGVMAGRGTDGGARDVAVLWSKGVATIVGPEGGVGLGVNDGGQVVGEYGSGRSLPFIATATTSKELPLLPGHAQGGAKAINTQGVAVGWSSCCTTTTAVRWGTSGQVEDLNTLLDPATVAAGWVVYRAFSIDDTGRILAVGAQNNGSWVSFMLVPSSGS